MKKEEVWGSMEYLCPSGPRSGPVLIQIRYVNDQSLFYLISERNFLGRRVDFDRLKREIIYIKSH